MGGRTMQLRGQPGLIRCLSPPPSPASLFKLSEKAKTLEVEMAKEKFVCAKGKESLTEGKQVAQGQLETCGKALEQQQQDTQLLQEQLRKVQSMCLPLDQDKFHADALKVWRDSLIQRSLDSLGYHYSLVPEIASLRRSCELLPGLMSTKVEELARGLRADIERVSRENGELRRQKLELERALQGAKEVQTRAGVESQERESKLKAECARQMQQAQEEKAVLRAKQDSLAHDLEARKRDLEQLRTEVEIRINALDTCLKAKVGMVLPVGTGAPGSAWGPGKVSLGMIGAEAGGCH